MQFSQNVCGYLPCMSSWVFTDMQSVHIRMNSSLSPPPNKNPGSTYDTGRFLCFTFRDLCRKLLYYNRQRKWYETHHNIFPGRMLKFKLNRAVCSAILMESSCISCLKVDSHFGLVCRSYKSVTRDRRSKQIYYNRQRKWYNTQRYKFSEKLLNFKLNRAVWSAIYLKILAFFCL